MALPTVRIYSALPTVRIYSASHEDGPLHMVRARSAPRPPPRSHNTKPERPSVPDQQTTLALGPPSV
ncbi:hypothetical protein ACFXC8_35695 [Streptomyces sp. NPDC059441]|uniref:hypothetical protein n=1 Tax=Streptomyces sp. NPDC059441 TaxID=3346829 RepID=UPI0036BA24A7